MWISKLQNVRWGATILLIGNSIVLLLGGFIVVVEYLSCDRHLSLPFLAVIFVSALRLFTMFRTAIAQEATAIAILDSHSSSSTSTLVVDSVRHKRRTTYKRWIYWTRFAMFVTLLQMICAAYLMYTILKSRMEKSSGCILGFVPDDSQGKKQLLVFFMIMLCSVILLQCFIGSDVLSWRSYYVTKDNAWKAHYREVFDHGIREALCCMGRVNYLSAMEEDEVFSVAHILGDLVAYRSNGTGHLELLAGLALLQQHSEPQKSFDEQPDAPDNKIQEAAMLHKFAEAAYTGPLLDVGRNPLIFPCVWLHRQGILTPWMRDRRPLLEGDNWWRGHAAAFLRYCKLSSNDLRQGRVSQGKCQAAYFVLVLHHLRSVVITVRGTETPEDLITDGLCRECILSANDLDGLINSNHIHTNLKQSVLSSFPHYGHSGIVESARELFMQIEGNLECNESNSSGLLSSLLGSGCECEGYTVRIVGHSLGGAIAALLGIRLYSRFPNLHVYAYGPLPCVDSVVANACSDFVTSVVFNNEFSACLSIGSVLRLRASAITSLSQDSNTDTGMIVKLSRRFLDKSNIERNKTKIMDPASNVYSVTTESENQVNCTYVGQDDNDSTGCSEEDQEISLWSGAHIEDSVIQNDPDKFLDPFATEDNSSHDPVSQFMGTVPMPENTSSQDPPEMYLPGVIIHIVTETKSSLWIGWGGHAPTHKAYIANRESFKDIIVSPSMFLDHFPWRCHYAMQKLLEVRSTQVQLRESQEMSQIAREKMEQIYNLISWRQHFFL